MNIIAIIILVAIIVDVLINILADFLNLKGLQSEVPVPFQDVYDADQYQKSQDYLPVVADLSYRKPIHFQIDILEDLGKTVGLNSNLLTK